MLALAVVMAIFLSLASTESKRYDYYSVRETAGRFADIIHAAYVGGNGFNGTFDVPTDIDGAVYNLTINNGSVIVSTYNYDKVLTASEPLVTKRVQTPSSGSVAYNSTQMGGDIAVVNDNGVIIVYS